eukprot:653379-Rhodomonas_salina.1
MALRAHAAVAWPRAAGRVMVSSSRLRPTPAALALSSSRLRLMIMASYLRAAILAKLCSMSSLSKLPSNLAWQA